MYLRPCRIGNTNEAETAESSIDRLTESVISCVVEDRRRLFRQTVEGLDERKIGSVDRLMRENRVQLIRRSLEILLASADERSCRRNVRVRVAARTA